MEETKKKKYKFFYPRVHKRQMIDESYPIYGVCLCVCVLCMHLKKKRVQVKLDNFFFFLLSTIKLRVPVCNLMMMIIIVAKIKFQHFLRRKKMRNLKFPNENEIKFMFKKKCFFCKQEKMKIFFRIQEKRIFEFRLYI